MPTRKKKEHDFSITALRVVKEATRQSPPPVPEEAQYGKRGRKGGIKGGKARAAKLTDAQRKKIAQKAAKARWGKR